jgi:hypothetical protein
MTYASTFSVRQDQEGTAFEAYAARQGLGGSVRPPTRTLLCWRIRRSSLSPP